ncbi:PQQ-binding-like beta-propeller repeat protein [Streptomyces sp. NPDC015144]|uniref:outer membrane protein assembly factor BamB family protein n=1 Tax=Streptomyces sp. NPDC015144 TaxID=3364944 RepID=UPI0036F7FECF
MAGARGNENGAGNGSGGEGGGGGGAAAGRRWTAYRPLIALGVALAALGGFGTTFLANSGHLPFFSMVTAWQTPYDSAPSGGGAGVWLVDDTVVRSRFDGMTGYDVRSGAKRWEHAVPGRTEVCAVDTDTTTAVTLLAHRAAGPVKERGNGKGCGTVVAVDLADGRELWRTAGERTGGGAVVGVGHGLGVFLDSREASRDTSRDTVRDASRVARHDGGRLRAVDLRTGAARWTAALPKGCALGDLGLSAQRLVAAMDCADGAVLTAFGPADGEVRWTVPLDTRRGADRGAGLSVVSADPPTVRAGGEAVLSFSPDGRPRGSIPVVGDRGRIVRTAVDHGRLLTITSYRNGPGGARERLVAFDLASGDELWRRDVGDGPGNVEALDVTDGRVTTVRTDWEHGDTLYVHDAATGDEKDDRTFRDQVADYGNPLRALLTHGDLLIVVRGYDGARPFSVYDRW